MQGAVSMEDVVSMQGQWKGSYSGDIDGVIMLNIDEMVTGYHIDIYIRPRNKNLPISVAEIKTDGKGLTQKVITKLYPLDPTTGRQSTWESVKKHYDKDSVYSDIFAVEFELKGDKLSIHSVAKSGDKLIGILRKPDQDAKSKIPTNLKSWAEFKEIVSKMEGSKQLFRGQQKPWKLSTAFHRGERYVISDFIDNDVEQLHQKLKDIISHEFDLSVSDQNDAFISLLQHHGYPTPLLDWSYSAYVAAFFAFRNVPLGYKGDGNTRIYIFNNEAWQRNNNTVTNLDLPFPHLSVMEFSAIDNPRVIPQQAVTIMTNIADIEYFFLKKQKKEKKEKKEEKQKRQERQERQEKHKKHKGKAIKYLKAIDIPASERDAVMRDLRFMGITAGSMFPGVDGACEEFRERKFKV